MARSVGEALLSTEVKSLASIGQIEGAGVYAIYYTGDFAPYKKVSALNKGGQFRQPIYVGKAIPAGARKGLEEFDAARGTALKARLEEHAESVRQASSTLKLEDFWFRALVVDDIWIPLGESVLIRTFSPLWNHSVEGFGNHDPGAGRHKSKVSPWDTLHPGRPWVERLTGGARLLRERVLENVKLAEADLDKLLSDSSATEKSPKAAR